MLSSQRNTRQSNTMPQRQDIDFILRHWSFQPGVVGARFAQGSDDRKVMQMRIEMGLLQMEPTGRPDGQRPGGAETYLDYLNAKLVHQGGSWPDRGKPHGDQPASSCSFITGGFAAWPCQSFARAVADADHTLALMDFVRPLVNRPGLDHVA